MSDNTVFVVHCIDTEGPLYETLEATFERVNSAFNLDLTASRETLNNLQEIRIDLDGKEQSVAKFVASKLLNYNENWLQIEQMLDVVLSSEFRDEMLDDWGNGWVYSWHCMDHMRYDINPRHKDVGYGNIFNRYRKILARKNCSQDEINWHFHPVSIQNNPLQAATSYTNSYSLLIDILCRRIIENDWFPTCNRPGFHSERPDAHMFMEQWIPFDYANQSYEEDTDQPDLAKGRFGDWRRASKSWRGYHPSHDDYQTGGHCRRKIFRCLNVGTRLRVMQKNHVEEAFNEAKDHGHAIVSFANHDYRDIRDDINEVRTMLSSVKKDFPDVKVKFAGAEDAARANILQTSKAEQEPNLELSLENNILQVRSTKGALFGPQPFLAIKTKSGTYLHDNFDFQKPSSHWSYTFDSQTIELSAIDTIGVASAGLQGNRSVKKILVS